MNLSLLAAGGGLILLVGTVMITMGVLRHRRMRQTRHGNDFKFGASTSGEDHRGERGDKYKSNSFTGRDGRGAILKSSVHNQMFGRSNKHIILEGLGSDRSDGDDIPGLFVFGESNLDSEALLTPSYYHGCISKFDAEQRLAVNNEQRGAFLVWQEPGSDKLFLSMHDGMRVRHFPIVCGHMGFQVLEENAASVHSLVKRLATKGTLCTVVPVDSDESWMHTLTVGCRALGAFNSSAFYNRKVSQVDPLSHPHGSAMSSVGRGEGSLDSEIFQRGPGLKLERKHMQESTGYNEGLLNRHGEDVGLGYETISGDNSSIAIGHDYRTINGLVASSSTTSSTVVSAAFPESKTHRKIDCDKSHEKKKKKERKCQGNTKASSATVISNCDDGDVYVPLFCNEALIPRGLAIYVREGGKFVACDGTLSMRLVYAKAEDVRRLQVTVVQCMYEGFLYPEYASITYNDIPPNYDFKSKDADKTSARESEIFISARSHKSISTSPAVQGGQADFRTNNVIPRSTDRVPPPVPVRTHIPGTNFGITPNIGHDYASSAGMRAKDGIGASKETMEAWGEGGAKGTAAGSTVGDRVNLSTKEFEFGEPDYMPSSSILAEREYVAPLAESSTIHHDYTRPFPSEYAYPGNYSPFASSSSPAYPRRRDVYAQPLKLLRSHPAIEENKLTKGPGFYSIFSSNPVYSTRTDVTSQDDGDASSGSGHIHSAQQGAGWRSPSTALNLVDPYSVREGAFYSVLADVQQVLSPGGQGDEASTGLQQSLSGISQSSTATESLPTSRSATSSGETNIPAKAKSSFIAQDNKHEHDSAPLLAPKIQILGVEGSLTTATATSTSKSSESTGCNTLSMTGSSSFAVRGENMLAGGQSVLDASANVISETSNTACVAEDYSAHDTGETADPMPYRVLRFRSTKAAYATRAQVVSDISVVSSSATHSSDSTAESYYYASIANNKENQEDHLYSPLAQNVVPGSEPSPLILSSFSQLTTPSALQSGSRIGQPYHSTSDRNHGALPGNTSLLLDAGTKMSEDKASATFADESLENRDEKIPTTLSHKARDLIVDAELDDSQERDKADKLEFDGFRHESALDHNALGRESGTLEHTSQLVAQGYLEVDPTTFAEPYLATADQ